MTVHASVCCRNGDQSIQPLLPRGHSRPQRECPASGGIRRPLPIAGLGWNAMSTRSTSRAASGRPVVGSSTFSTSRVTWLGPLAITSPYSVRWPRTALTGPRDPCAILCCVDASRLRAEERGDQPVSSAPWITRPGRARPADARNAPDPWRGDRARAAATPPAQLR